MKSLLPDHVSQSMILFVDSKNSGVRYFGILLLDDSASLGYTFNYHTYINYNNNNNSN